MLTHDLLCQDGEFGDDVASQLEHALTVSNIDTASADSLYEDYLTHAKKYLQDAPIEGDYRFLTYKGLLFALYD